MNSQQVAFEKQLLVDLQFLRDKREAALQKAFPGATGFGFSVSWNAPDGTEYLIDTDNP